MRIIDADALIDELKKDEAKFDKEAKDAQNDPSYTECYSDAMWSRANGIRDAIIEVYDAPTIDAVSEWIPCSERLPERGEDVLITDEYGDVSIASIEYSTPHPWQSVYEFHIEYMVYAWMPLPEPWEGADDE